MRIIRVLMRLFAISLIIFLIVYIFAIIKDIFGIYYNQMTHLTTEDLKWIDGAKNHPSAIFVSDSGDTSRLTVTGWNIDDKHNPFIFSTGHSQDFEANATYLYNVIDSVRTLEGGVYFTRAVDNDTLCALYQLGGMFGGVYERCGVPMHPQCVVINKKLFNNCIVVDSSNAENSPYWVENKPLHLMDKFVISKDYGLIYYKLKDGEEFFRQFDEP